MFPNTEQNPLADAPIPEEMMSQEQEEMPAKESDELDEELQKALKELLLSARDEDRFVRDAQLRLWKRLEYYWNNILDIFLDPISRDWRVPDWDALEEEGEIPPRLINIYRPLGEAVVAALSVNVPSVLYHPDDADNPDDIETSKAYRSINEMIDAHDDKTMLFIKALTILFNQGTVFCYNYHHSDPKYGTISKPKVEFKDVNTFTAHCPECGEPLDSGVQGKHEEGYQCLDCGYQGPADVNEGVESLPQITGFDETPKGTIKRDLYSGLNIKVPAYVKGQDHCGYLLLEFAQSVPMLRSIFKEHMDKIESKQDSTFEGFSKLPTYYLGQQPENAANVSCIWLRPWQYYQLGHNKLDQISELERLFPNGCYAIFINDDFMEAYPEKLDDHWTISDNPLGQFIYSRPLGENLSTVQDIRAQLVEIELQTAEYGIPETFVDERVLDLERYGSGQAKPGMVTSAKPRSGKSMSDAFYQTKAATLSQEIDPLRQHIDQDSQLVSGAFPSVYGGISQGGSNTATEYTQSKNMALQRLNITWKIITTFWTKLQARSAVEYANVLKESGQDAKFSKKTDSGSFINVWVRQASLNGKIGRVEPECTDQLPNSWAQKKDAIFQLITSQVPEALSVLMHPNNAGIVKEAFGLQELYVPGEENRIRQQKEFQLLSQGVTVPINELVDEHEVHIEVLKHLMSGPFGDSLTDEGLNACMEHLMMHMQVASKAEAGSPNEESETGSTAPDQEAEVQ